MENAEYQLQKTEAFCQIMPKYRRRAPVSPIWKNHLKNRIEMKNVIFFNFLFKNTSPIQDVSIQNPSAISRCSGRIFCLWPGDRGISPTPGGTRAPATTLFCLFYFYLLVQVQQCSMEDPVLICVSFLCVPARGMLRTYCLVVICFSELCCVCA